MASPQEVPPAAEVRERTKTMMLGDVALVPNEGEHHAHKPNMERGQVLRYLRHVEVFKDFKKKDLAAVCDALELQDYQAGETVIRKGQRARAFYMIKYGTVGFDVEGNGKIKGTRGPAEYFGEIALIEGGVCSATAIAHTDCEFYVLSKIQFDKLLKDQLAQALDPLHNGLAGLLDAGGRPHMVSAEVQRMLKEYDTDGDGQFSVDEVEVIITSLLQTKKQTKNMKYILAATFVAFLAACTSMFLMSLAGAEVAKDVSQADSGPMIVKGTDTVVQVASFEMTVAPDGTLVSRTEREDGGRRRRLEEFNSTDAGPAIRTAPAPSKIVALSSDLPVEYFHTMENLLIDDHAGLSLNFKVLSGGRMPASWAASGNGYVMVMHTIAGRVIIDGTEMHFDEEMSAALEGEGLELEPQSTVLPSGGAGRRLQIGMAHDHDHDARRRLQDDACSGIEDKRECRRKRVHGKKACAFNARRRRRSRAGRKKPDGCSARRWYSASVAVAIAPPPPPEVCLNEHNEIVNCCSRECAVDCKGKWTQWSKCSRKCQPGYQTRTYVHTRAASGWYGKMPRPEYRGIQCHIAAGTTERRSCHIEECTVEDVMEEQGDPQLWRVTVDAVDGCDQQYSGSYESVNTNVALFGTASQSSTYTNPQTYAAVASLAIDGVATGTCSHTHFDVYSRPPEGTNWWQLDLGKPYSISKINIFSQDRSRVLRGTELYVSETSSYAAGTEICNGNICRDANRAALLRGPFRGGNQETVNIRGHLQSERQFVTVVGENKHVSICEMQVVVASEPCSDIYSNTNRLQLTELAFDGANVLPPKPSLPPCEDDPSGWLQTGHSQWLTCNELVLNQPTVSVQSTSEFYVKTEPNFSECNDWTKPVDTQDSCEAAAAALGYESVFNLNLPVSGCIVHATEGNMYWSSQGSESSSRHEYQRVCWTPSNDQIASACESPFIHTSLDTLGARVKDVCPVQCESCPATRWRMTVNTVEGCLGDYADVEYMPTPEPEAEPSVWLPDESHFKQDYFLSQEMAYVLPPSRVVTFENHGVQVSCTEARGRGYMMYTEQNARQRFGSNRRLQTDDAHFVCVQYRNAEWLMHGSDRRLHSFRPHETDVLVAEIKEFGERRVRHQQRKIRLGEMKDEEVGYPAIQYGYARGNIRVLALEGDDFNVTGSRFEIEEPGGEVLAQGLGCPPGTTQVNTHSDCQAAAESLAENWGGLLPDLGSPENDTLPATSQLHNCYKHHSGTVWFNPVGQPHGRVYVDNEPEIAVCSRAEFALAQSTTCADDTAQVGNAEVCERAAISLALEFGGVQLVNTSGVEPVLSPTEQLHNCYLHNDGLVYFNPVGSPSGRLDDVREMAICWQPEVQPDSDAQLESPGSCGNTFGETPAFAQLTEMAFVGSSPKRSSSVLKTDTKWHRDVIGDPQVHGQRHWEHLWRSPDYINHHLGTTPAPVPAQPLEYGVGTERVRRSAFVCERGTTAVTTVEECRLAAEALGLHWAGELSDRRSNSMRYERHQIRGCFFSQSDAGVIFNPGGPFLAGQLESPGARKWMNDNLMSEMCSLAEFALSATSACARDTVQVGTEVACESPRRYAVVESTACPAGSRQVTSEEECELAASSVGYPWGGLRGGNVSFTDDRPASFQLQNCYRHHSGQVVFNPDGRPEGRQDTFAEQAVCVYSSLLLSGYGYCPNDMRRLTAWESCQISAATLGETWGGIQLDDGEYRISNQLRGCYKHFTGPIFYNAVGRSVKYSGRDDGMPERAVCMQPRIERNYSETWHLEGALGRRRAQDVFYMDSTSCGACSDGVSTQSDCDTTGMCQDSSCDDRSGTYATDSFVDSEGCVSSGCVFNAESGSCSSSAITKESCENAEAGTCSIDTLSSEEQCLAQEGVWSTPMWYPHTWNSWIADGECDEPAYCAVGLDTVDCTPVPLQEPLPEPEPAPEPQPSPEPEPEPDEPEPEPEPEPDRPAIEYLNDGEGGLSSRGDQPWQNPSILECELPCTIEYSLPWGFEPSGVRMATAGLHPYMPSDVTVEYFHEASGKWIKVEQTELSTKIREQVNRWNGKWQRQMQTGKLRPASPNPLSGIYQVREYPMHVSTGLVDPIVSGQLEDTFPSPFGAFSHSGMAGTASAMVDGIGRSEPGNPQRVDCELPCTFTFETWGMPTALRMAIGDNHPLMPSDITVSFFSEVGHNMDGTQTWIDADDLAISAAIENHTATWQGNVELGRGTVFEYPVIMDFDCRGYWTEFGECTPLCDFSAEIRAMRTYIVTRPAMYQGSWDTCDAADGTKDFITCDYDPSVCQSDISGCATTADANCWTDSVLGLNFLHTTDHTGSWAISPGSGVDTDGNTEVAVSVGTRFTIPVCVQVSGSYQLPEVVAGGQAWDAFELQCQLGDPAQHMHGDLVIGATATVATGSSAGWSIFANVQDVDGTISTGFMVRLLDDVFLGSLDAVPGDLASIVSFATDAVVSPLTEASLHLGNLRLSSKITNTLDMTTSVSGEISFKNMPKSDFTVENPGQIMMHILTSVGEDHYPTFFAEVKTGPPTAGSSSYKLGFGIAPMCIDDTSSRSGKDEDCSDSRLLAFGFTDDCWEEPAGCDDTDLDSSNDCGLECECNCNVRLDAGNGLGFYVDSLVQYDALRNTNCGTADGTPPGPTVCTTYELGLGFKVDVGGGNTLHFLGSSAYSVPNTAPSIAVDLRMVGVWEGAFGIDKLHLADAIFAFSLKLPITMPPVLNSVTLGATVFIGTHDCTNCDEVSNCVGTNSVDEETGVATFHEPTGSCKELGAYASVNFADPSAAGQFGLVYGTETPSLLDIVGLFVSSDVTNLLAKIPAIKTMFTMTLGPYYSTETCSARDMATIADGCGGCKDADGNNQCDSLDDDDCYELFQECYFVAWFAPDGVSAVQKALKTFEGPTKVLNVLPSASSYGFSGSVSVGGATVGVSMNVGFAVPVLGSTYMEFSAYINLFNFFTGEIYFSYDYGIDNPSSVAQQISVAIATGDDSSVQSIINSIVPNPSFSMAARVVLDVTSLKEKVMTKITNAMNVQKWKNKITDITSQMGNTKKFCRKVNVPNGVCKMVPNLGSVISTAVSTGLNPAFTALTAITSALTAAVNAIFSTTLEADIAAWIKSNSQGDTDASFDFDLKVCYNNKCLTASVSVSASIDGIDSELVEETAEGIYKNIITLAGKGLDDAEEEFTKGFDKTKDALTGAAGDLFSDMSDIGNDILGGLKNTYAAAGGVFGGSRSSCGKDGNFGFQKCRDCDEMGGTYWKSGRLKDTYLQNYKDGNWEFRGMRRQHAIEDHTSGTPSKEQCFGVCFDLALDIYTAWTDATTYETVALDTNRNAAWYADTCSSSLDPTEQTHCHVVETMDTGDDESTCESDCTADINCVGYSFDGSSCRRARYLPSHGPWACHWSATDATRGPSWGTKDQYLCDEGFWDSSATNQYWYRTNWDALSDSNRGYSGYSTIDTTSADYEQGRYDYFHRRKNSKMVEYTFPDGETDRATIYDWTAGSCCRQNKNNKKCIFAPGSGKSGGTSTHNWATPHVWCDSVADPLSGCDGAYENRDE